MRPIVMRCEAPTYFLEKAFVLLLNDLLLALDFVVNSTAEFVEHIKMLKISHECILASMDVKSLFPSIDISEVNSYISSLIDSSEKYSDNIKHTLKSGIQLITNNNFFMFDGKVYEQNMGAFSRNSR